MILESEVGVTFFSSQLTTTLLGAYIEAPVGYIFISITQLDQVLRTWVLQDAQNLEVWVGVKPYMAKTIKDVVRVV